MRDQPQVWRAYDRAEARRQRERRDRQCRLHTLAVVCTVLVAAVFLLASCNPSPLEDAQAPVSGSRVLGPTPTTQLPVEWPIEGPDEGPAGTTPGVTSAVNTSAPTTSPPAPEPEVVPLAAELHPAIVAHFGSGQLGHQAQAVAQCESQLDAGAVSPTADHGLFQVNRPTWDKPEAWDGWQQQTGTSWSMVYDPWTNAQFARALYDRSGWTPWTCQP